MRHDLNERVVGGARRVLAERGWADATLERIAVEAGVSRMTLHRHGVGRDDVLALLAARLEEDYRAALWPALTGPGTGRERLGRALRAECAVAEENLALLAALGEVEHAAIYHEDGEGALTREVFTAPLVRLLADGVADGSLRRVDDPAETATTLFNTVGFSYRHLRVGHGWAPERSCRAVLALVVDGLAA